MAFPNTTSAIPVLWVSIDSPLELLKPASYLKHLLALGHYEYSYIVLTEWDKDENMRFPELLACFLITCLAAGYNIVSTAYKSASTPAPSSFFSFLFF